MLSENETARDSRTAHVPRRPDRTCERTVSREYPLKRRSVRAALISGKCALKSLKPKQESRDRQRTHTTLRPTLVSPMDWEPMKTTYPLGSLCIYATSQVIEREIEHSIKRRTHHLRRRLYEARRRLERHLIRQHHRAEHAAIRAARQARRLERAAGHAARAMTPAPSSTAMSGAGGLPSSGGPLAAAGAGIGGVSPARAMAVPFMTTDTPQPRHRHHRRHHHHRRRHHHRHQSHSDAANASGAAAAAAGDALAIGSLPYVAAPQSGQTPRGSLLMVSSPTRSGGCSLGARATSGLLGSVVDASFAPASLGQGGAGPTGGLGIGSGGGGAGVAGTVGSGGPGGIIGAGGVGAGISSGEEDAGLASSLQSGVATAEEGGTATQAVDSVAVTTSGRGWPGTAVAAAAAAVAAAATSSGQQGPHAEPGTATAAARRKATSGSGTSGDGAATTTTATTTTSEDEVGDAERRGGRRFVTRQ